MLHTIVDVFQLASALTGLIYFQSIENKWLKSYIVVFAVTSLAEVIFAHIKVLSGTGFRIFYCLTIPVEYSLIVLLFIPFITQRLIIQRLFHLSIAVLAVFSFYKLLTSLNEASAATDVFLMAGLAKLILLLFYFQQITRSRQVVFLSRDPIFWIATSMLFYLTGSLIVTGFYSKLYERSPNLALNLFYINYSLAILRSILFSIAFVIAARKLPHE